MTDKSPHSEMPVPSPCVGICCIGGDGLCFGCFRTRPELSAWGTASEAEKREILARCQARSQASNQAQSGFPGHAKGEPG